MHWSIWQRCWAWKAEQEEKRASQSDPWRKGKKVSRSRTASGYRPTLPGTFFLRFHTSWENTKRWHEKGKSTLLHRLGLLQYGLLSCLCISRNQIRVNNNLLNWLIKQKSVKLPDWLEGRALFKWPSALSPTSLEAFWTDLVVVTSDCRRQIEVRRWNSESNKV